MNCGEFIWVLSSLRALHTTTTVYPLPLYPLVFVIVIFVNREGMFRVYMGNMVSMLYEYLLEFQNHTPNV
eukprot:SAG31_NODE_2957_length_4857_cov_47.100883_7_plen_70_part_00